MFAKVPTITKLPQPFVEQESQVAPPKVGLGFLCLPFAALSESRRYLPVPAGSWPTRQLLVKLRVPSEFPVRIKSAGAADRERRQFRRCRYGDTLAGAAGCNW